MKDEMTALMHTLMTCITACEVCADACLDEPRAEHLRECIRLDRDCADICGLTARYVARGSRRTADVLKLCTAICELCRTECAGHAHDHCRACAAACLQCRDACLAYAEIARW